MNDKSREIIKLLKQANLNELNRLSEAVLKIQNNQETMSEENQIELITFDILNIFEGDFADCVINFLSNSTFTLILLHLI